MKKKSDKSFILKSQQTLIYSSATQVSLNGAFNAQRNVNEQNKKKRERRRSEKSLPAALITGRAVRGLTLDDLALATIFKLLLLPLLLRDIKERLYVASRLLSSISACSGK